MSRRRSTNFRALAACALALLGARLAAAAGPEPKHWFPLGVRRGDNVEVSVGGNFPKWPVSVWVDRPGVTAAAGEEKGKLSVTAAADATPGVYWMRLYDSDAAAAPRPFVVGTLEEALEKEPNNAPGEAQAVGSSIVVNGRLSPGGDVDVFGVQLAKDQTLVASLVAHETLGSPVDAVLQIVEPRGNVLAYNHDHGGLDPQIAFVAPADGPYLVRVFGFPSSPNSSIGFSGNDAYVYRLTLSVGGFVDYPWPLAVAGGAETSVELFGWNIPEALRSRTLRGEPPIAALFDPQLANVAHVAVEPYATVVEAETNDPAAPQTIDVPVAVTGRIEADGDADVFAFNAKKGESLVFELASRTLGYPTDGVLEVTDASGKSLARVDDAGGTRDPVITFAPPADGTFCISVSDLYGHGSPRHVYRLRATKAKPDFAVTADAQAYVLAAGKSTEVTLAVERRNGFAEEITFRPTGLPDGVTAEPVTSAGSGDSAKSVKLVLASSGGPFSGPIRIRGESSGEDKRAHEVEAAIPGHQARTRDLWLTVVGAAE